MPPPSKHALKLSKLKREIEKNKKPPENQNIVAAMKLRSKLMLQARGKRKYKKSNKSKKSKKSNKSKKSRKSRKSKKFRK